MPKRTNWWNLTTVNDQFCGFPWEGHQIWAGDGPHGADCATNAAHCSLVKILSFDTGAVINVVNTGGSARADELCFDPKDHLAMIANDADNPPFVTFISTKGNNKILGKISIPESNGIEQCQWNPRNGRIYLNIPSTTDDSSGKVYVIDPRHETIVNVGIPSRDRGAAAQAFLVTNSSVTGPARRCIGNRTQRCRESNRNRCAEVPWKVR